MNKLVFIFLSLISFSTTAQKISGMVFNDKGDLLPYASVTIKGTSIGASANNKGKFSINVSAGTYTVICQHIGYARQEKKVTVTTNDEEVSFILTEQKMTMKEVLVKTGGEDPAYEVIRKAIKKREYYNTQVKSFECDVYSKDIIKLRDLPRSFFGQKIPDADRKEIGLDTGSAPIIYLSEQVARVHQQLPDKSKLDIISSRVSGSNSFSFSFPAFISLYKSNVTVFTEKFNPRGFVSPIADGAISFYKFKYLGSFFEDGKEIINIRVTPRRNYEPLFSGIINIVEGDWRIHSFDLYLTKKSQLEIMDTLGITQIHVPVGKDIWRVKNQLLHFNFNKFKIDAIGNFVNVYSNYNINPTFPKKFFDNIVIKYDTAVNKRPKKYWDTVRPVPLEPEEVKDYKVKDSIFEIRRDSMMTKRSRDSLNKNQGKIKPLDIFIHGISRRHYGKTNTYTWGIHSLLPNLRYNTVEGLVMNVEGFYNSTLKKSKTRLSIEPNLRYGFSNTHLNGWVDVTLRTRDFGNDKKIKRETWIFSGGKRVSQFNSESTINPVVNSISTLLWGNNYLKIYENWFGKVGFAKRYESGLNFSINALYEDRIPLANTTDFTIWKKDSINITPNFPSAMLRNYPGLTFTRHQAAVLSFDISIKPGQRYIQLPKTKIPIGSKYPTFSFNYTKGINGIFGSDVDYDKWRFTINDDKNFKLAGLLKYKIGIGGFINSKKVEIPDYQHFNGNETKGNVTGGFKFASASEYVNSFQLASYYGNSTKANFYSFGHVEHHFNGLLTNKIPLFNRLNWNLVAGSNALYVNKNNNYVEAFAGLENIFKIFRLDLVYAYENGKRGLTGLRLGAGGLLGGSIPGTKGGGSASTSGRSVTIGF
ncbi:MAG: DUF5686 and carboxypeptidase regulatory-like domain-containing protein [Ferruginibacter sp.]